MQCWHHSCRSQRRQPARGGSAAALRSKRATLNSADGHREGGQGMRGAPPRVPASWATVVARAT
jgi:hypothetical protein